MTDPNPQAQVEPLAVARRLLDFGVPLFVAPADQTQKLGFRLPKGWQSTTVDPSVLDTWRAGDALCAVMGHGLDLIDLDPRNGADPSKLGAPLPPRMAVASTPSGGLHLFVLSQGVRSRDNIAPGIDFKGGQPDGEGRGFAFIAPTIRPSKETGVNTPYLWVEPFDTADIADGDALISLGRPFAEWVRSLHGVTKTPTVAGPVDAFTATMDAGTVIHHTPKTARAAIDRELSAVASWSAASGIGFRTVLLRAAFVLGGYVAARPDAPITDEQARAELHDAVVASTWEAPPNDDDLLWIQQGLTDGATRPFHVAQEDPAFAQTADSQARVDAVATETDPWPYHPKAEYRLGAGITTDQEHANWVLMYLWDRWRYIVETGSWITRSGDRWIERPARGVPTALIAQVASCIPRGVEPEDPKDASGWTEANWQWTLYERYHSSAKSRGIVQRIEPLVLPGQHRSAISEKALDHTRDVLWAGGTPWDLRELRAADIDPGTPHLRTAAVVPELSGSAPAWEAFVKAVWPDEEIGAWALRVLSISLTGYADAALPVLYGPAGRGKTSVVSLIMDLLGDYAHSADPRLLTSANAHASIYYDLKGRRLSFIDEGPRDTHNAKEALKALTGGGKITGNAMGQNPVSFAATHTLVMTSNDEPTITDDAIRRRIRAIPCEGDADEVRRTRAVLDIKDVWKAEAPVVLGRLMAEASAWLADKTTALTTAAPVALQARTQAMAEDQDPIRTWLLERTESDDQGTLSSALLTAFNPWWRDQGGKPFTATAFGRALAKHGVERVHRESGWHWMLRLRNGGWPSGLTGQPVSPPNPSAQPVSPSFPTSTPVLLTSTDGLTGFHQYSQEEKEKKQDDHVITPPIYAAIEEQPVSRQPTSQSPRLTSDDDPDGLPSPKPVRAARDLVKAPEPDKPVLLSRTQSLKTASDQRKLQKVAEKEQRVAEAAGETFELPVLVRRGESPRSVSRLDAMIKIREAMAADGQSLTVDVETSGYPIGYEHYRLKTVQLGSFTQAIVLDPHDPEQAKLISSALLSAPALKAFNAAADLAPLAHEGLADHDMLWAKMRDVAIPAKLSDPAGTSNSDGLKDTSAKLLGDAAVARPAEVAKDALFATAGWLKDPKKWAETPPERNGWHQVDPTCSVMLTYAASDVLDTAPLDRLLPQHPEALLERERAIQRSVSLVSTKGFQLDRDRVHDKHAEFTTNRANALALCASLGMPEPGSPTKVAARLIELNAPVPLTKQGNPSVRAGVVEPWAKQDDEIGQAVRALLDYRHWAQGLSLILNPWLALVDHGDGRVRSTIYTLGADTGRMSSVRQNMQQISKEGGLRECIAADPGTALISADFSGVEIRVFAALSGDPGLKAMIEEDDANPGQKLDLHWRIARMVYGPDATKANRYNVKSDVFGRLYGGGVETLAEQSGESIETTQRVLDYLDQLTPTATAWATHVKIAIKAGYREFPTYAGRTIIFDPAFPHKGPNFAVQGTARELTGDAVLDWTTTPFAGDLVLPVHDEIVAQVAEDRAEEAQAALLGCMEREINGIRIKAEPGDGPSDHWWSAV